MDKQEAVLRYKVSMAIFKGWYRQGTITGEELLQIDTLIAQKYGLSLSSIHRENELQFSQKYANMA